MGFAFPVQETEGGSRVSGEPDAFDPDELVMSGMPPVQLKPSQAVAFGPDLYRVYHDSLGAKAAHLPVADVDADMAESG